MTRSDGGRRDLRLREAGVVGWPCCVKQDAQWLASTGRPRRRTRVGRNVLEGGAPGWLRSSPPGALFGPAWAVGDAATSSCQEDAVTVMVAGRDGQLGPGPQSDGVG